MERFVPNNLLCVFEHWFGICYTCVSWGSLLSGFFKLECGVRQGGVLSPYFFAINIDNIIDKPRDSGLGCYFKSVSMCCFLYADDIILLAPSIDALQRLINLCQTELELLDLTFNFFFFLKLFVCVLAFVLTHHVLVCQTFMTRS